MRLLTLLTLLVFCVTCFAQWTPIDYQTVRNDADTTVKQTRIGGELMHYPNGGTWEPIDNTWTTVGQGANKKWLCTTDVLTAEVDRLGTSIATTTWNDTTYQITQDFLGIVVEDTSTGQVWDFGFNNPSFGTPDVFGDTLRWTIFTGISYEVIKQNAALIHRISFDPAISQNAILWATNQFGSLENLTVSTNIDVILTNLDEPETGVVYETEFKNFGRYKLAMRRQQLQYDGSDTLAGIPIEQNWSAGNMKERVHLPNVQAILNQNPNAVISHNDQTTVGDANIEDAMIRDGAFIDYNYGATVQPYVGRTSAGALRSLIRCTDLVTLLGADQTISAAGCSLMSHTRVIGTPDVSAYKIWKNQWVEGNEDGVDNDDGDVTWNDWASDANEWGTAGCSNADDGGSYNSGDGTGADRMATAEASPTTIVAIETWYTWSITVATATEWYEGNEGGLLLQDAEDDLEDFRWRSVSHGTGAERPRFWFVHTTGGAAAASKGQIINVMEE